MPTVIAETERLFIRTMDETGCKIVCELFKERESYKKAKDRSFQKVLLTCLWNDAKQETTYNGLIFLRDTHQFCGRVCVQHTDRAVPELGIDILRGYQNRGIGPEAVKAFVDSYCVEQHVPRVDIRIQKDNRHCIHVFEKLGAKYDGFFPFYSPEVLDAIKKQHPGEDISELEEPTIHFYHFDIPIRI